jgi:ABC-type nitrate/sulfonate/bicarbonate transport system substrate-binding protein
MKQSAYYLTRMAIVFSVFSLLIFFLPACSKKQPEEKPTVRMGYLNIVASLPLFVAEEKGFFKDEGIQYEATAIATSNQLVDAVVAGNLDCYIESSAVPVLAVELQSSGKLKVFSVSEITPQAPFDALLVKEDSPIKTLSDLSGKRIGVFPGSTATNLLKKYLTDKKIDISSTSFVPMPPANHLAALLEGSIDALHAYEPTTAIAMNKGGIRQIHGSVYAEMLSPNPQGVAAINVTFINKYPNTAAKVVRAFERAMVFMKEHDAETRQILAKKMGLSEDVSKRCVFLYMLPHDQIPVDIFQQYSDMLTDLGELSGRVQVEKLLYHK